MRRRPHAVILPGSRAFPGSDRGADAIDEELPDITSPTPDDEQVRALAIRQIERKRRFQARAFAYCAICVVLTVIWAISEYNNAGGWPTSGFSQSSSIPHTWNIWIVYPVLGLGLVLATDAWNTFGRRPISEGEIQREIDRMRGR